MGMRMRVPAVLLAFAILVVLGSTIAHADIIWDDDDDDVAYPLHDAAVGQGKEGPATAGVKGICAVVWGCAVSFWMALMNCCCCKRTAAAT